MLTESSLQAVVARRTKEEGIAGRVSKVGGRESGDSEEERLEWRDGAAAHVAAEASECRARFHDLNPYLMIILVIVGRGIRSE